MEWPVGSLPRLYHLEQTSDWLWPLHEPGGHQSFSLVNSHTDGNQPSTSLEIVSRFSLVNSERKTLIDVVGELGYFFDFHILSVQATVYPHNMGLESVSGE